MCSHYRCCRQLTGYEVYLRAAILASEGPPCSWMRMEVAHLQRGHIMLLMRGRQALAPLGWCSCPQVCLFGGHRRCIAECDGDRPHAETLPDKNAFQVARQLAHMVCRRASARAKTA